VRFEVDKIVRVKIRVFWVVNPSGLHFYPEFTTLRSVTLH